MPGAMKEAALLSLAEQMEKLLDRSLGTSSWLAAVTVPARAFQSARQAADGFWRRCCQTLLLLQGKMTREQYQALRRKVGGTARGFFKEYVSASTAPSHICTALVSVSLGQLLNHCCSHQPKPWQTLLAGGFVAAGKVGNCGLQQGAPCCATACHHTSLTHTDCVMSLLAPLLLLLVCPFRLRRSR